MNLRSRLSTLIAVRVVIGTLLLGSAILIQISRPGAFPVDPFFFLIGLTYALSVALPGDAQVRRAASWLVDLQFGADAHPGLGVHPRHRRHHQLLLVAVSAADHRGEHDPLPARRAAGGGAQRGAVSGARAGAVRRRRPAAAGRRFTPVVELPTLRVAQYTVAINLSGFFAVALLAGSLAEGLRSAGARLEDASHEIRDLRAFNEYVINSLLSGLVTADADGRILTFNRAASTITRHPERRRRSGTTRSTCCSCRRDIRARLATLGETRSLQDRSRSIAPATDARSTSA